ncbi:MAG TPA: hypothetical protein VJ506_12365 [Candidatus Limnocylindrales bacterium]|nr:hypothetical protein [Candidatus Limnocylindrales bacterium]
MDWLLESDEPAVRYRTRTWLSGEDERDASVRRDRARVADGAIVATLLEATDPRETPYRKWRGLHWRLVSLADFGLPADQPAVRARLDEAIDRELRWIANPRHLEAIPRLDGLYRADASMEGNGLYAACRFGHARDERARSLVEKLLEWQWPDGGWNCDRRASGYRSSFHESWATAIGLAAYHDATGDDEALAAARRTAELLLEHRLLRTLDGRRQIHSSMAALHWPAYWHYDFLAGLRVLLAVDSRLLRDPRAADALDLLESKARPDGRFETSHAWWQAGRHVTSPTDVVDWGRGRPSEVLTLHALRVLKAAGREGP